MATIPTHILSVSNCTLDPQCKGTLLTMIKNGWTKAHTPYSATQQVLTPGELRHLLQHGGLALPSGPVATLNSYVVPKPGAPGYGLDVGFKLNVDLIA